MSKVTVFIADGTEESECIIAVDLLRRADIETELVSYSSSREVITSHNVKITADKAFDEASFDGSDMLFIPGGKKGVANLSVCKPLLDAVKKHAESGKYVAAVCAGPTILGKIGLLEGKNATCFPGFEDGLTGAIVTGEGVVADGKILTGRGLGFSIDLTLKMIEVLEGKEKAREVKEKIQHPATI